MTVRVLVANRGEIAVRILRCCRRMGLPTVAVFSEADRDAPHVRAADAAVGIGAAEAALSYLDAAAVINAARRTGATAIHPGYGFLAENAEFAQRCQDEGLTFIGPAPAVMRRMGSKTAAREAARENGVPVLPGSSGGDDSDAVLCAAAVGIGMPVMVKARAGGGGRGMRRVDRIEDLAEALRMARAEARAGFGDDTVFLERALHTPRHVEVQILADRHGKVLHAHERDCSIQRFHQKVLEEAPAPFLSATLRATLAAHAVRLARAVGYDSVGTMEFLVDSETGEAFFLEMNTRLQVEHTVTEMVTGLDLVECQIRAALGEALPFAQADIEVRGHAIEVRIAAEDPARNFAPTTGVVHVYGEPAIEGVRIDSGIGEGSEIGPYYDSLLAKVIACGADRHTALARLRQALAGLHIAGLRTNTAFLAALAAHPALAAGSLGTDFLAREFPGGWREPDVGFTLAALAAIAWVCAKTASGSVGADASAWRTLGAWRVTAPAGHGGRAYLGLVDEERTVLELCVSDHGGPMTVTSDTDRCLEVEGVQLRDGAIVYRIAGVTQSATVTRHGHGIAIQALGATRHFEVLAAEARGCATPGGGRGGADLVLTAPMPGMVTEVRLQPGDPVVAGQPVVVLEAMKLLHTLSAPVSGTIGAVHCAAGERIAGGRVLVEFIRQVEGDP